MLTPASPGFSDCAKCVDKLVSHLQYASSVLLSLCALQATASILVQIAKCNYLSVTQTSKPEASARGLCFNLKKDSQQQFLLSKTEGCPSLFIVFLHTFVSGWVARHCWRRHHALAQKSTNAYCDPPCYLYNYTNYLDSRGAANQSARVDDVPDSNAGPAELALTASLGPLERKVLRLILVFRFLLSVGNPGLI